MLTATEIAAIDAAITEFFDAVLLDLDDLDDTWADAHVLPATFIADPEVPSPWGDCLDRSDLAGMSIVVIEGI